MKTNMELIPTKALQNTSKNVEFKSTIFTSYKSKPKNSEHKPIKSINSKNSEKSDSDSLTLKRATHDIIKFSNTSSNSYGKTRAQLAAELAIRLGAKKAKNEYRNYKEIIAENKEKRKIIAEKAQMQQLGKTSEGTAAQKYKKVRSAKHKKLLNKPIITHYGVVNPKLKVKRKKN